MALLKNVGLTGSVAGGLLLLLFVPRGSGPNTTLQTGYKNAQASTSNEKSGGSKSSIAGNKKWPAEGPWKASRQYFSGVQTEPSCVLKADQPTKNIASLNAVDLKLQSSGDDQVISQNKERSKLWCIPPLTPVAAIIATAPDPVHSHLSLGFDRTIEALQLSGESMWYEMDQYWLPWQPKLPGTASTQQDQDNSEKEKQPGLLMFRWNGPADDSVPKVLYVFLVAETSTTGINGTQFRNAVQYVQQVCSEAGTSAIGCSNDKHIVVMGPSFSGSLASLRQLSDFVPVLTANRPYFDAFSGTLSSGCAIKTQGLPTQHYPPGELLRCSENNIPSPPAHLTLQSLVVDSETVVRSFLVTLKINNAIQCGDGKSSQVAILSEAATTYGNAAGAMKAQANQCSYADFRYPREISSLRNASASSEPPAVGSQPTSASDGPAYLPFTLADQQPNSSDEPPDFSQTQGPLSKEAVMMKYAADLRRGGYKYVGIIGSNVVDVLFIARFLRSACPDVRLFILDSDLLFERDGDDAPYIGTLAVTTYPLIGRNLDWTLPQQPKATDFSQPSQPRFPFSDQFQEGQYNASILAMRKALVSDAGILMEVDGPFTAGSASFKPESSILPLWLTVVGTGGYWPVQIIIPQSPKGEQSSRPQMQQQDFSAAWQVVTISLVALAFLLSLILLTVKPNATWLSDFSLINAAPAQRFLFINVVSVSLAFALSILITSAWKFGLNAGAYVWVIKVAALWAIGALIFSCLVLALHLEKLRREEKWYGGNRAYFVNGLFSAAVWMIGAAGAYIWWGLHYDDASHYGFFFGYRSVHLATGVSPLTPMLLLLFAVFLWGMFEVWRLRFSDTVRPRLNPDQLNSDEPDDSPEAMIANSINRFFLSPMYVFIFILTFGAWLLSLHPKSPFGLFEKNNFGQLYEVLLCFVVALMITSGLRLVQTWSQLYRFLQKLERSPIGPAFSRLSRSKGINWSSIWLSSGRKEEWTRMAQSFEAMEQIKRCEECPDLKLDEHIKASLDKRDEIRDAAKSTAGRFPFLEKLFSELQNSFAVVLNDVLNILEKHWKECRPEPTASDKPVSSDKSVVCCCRNQVDPGPDPELKKWRLMEEYVALRLVAFIRGVLEHIRLWLIFQAAVFSLVLLSLNVYSFEPHKSLLWSFTTAFAVIGMFAIGVLMQIDRNHVISRITGTEPNKLEPGFYLRIAMLGAVPLLTLLATHFPSIGNYLMSLLQPGMEALK
jgi:hypothetical protein